MSDRAESFIERLYPKKLKAELEDWLGEKLPKDFSWGDAAIMRLCLSASTEGDTTAVREIREAIEGKARQRIELGGFITDDGESEEDGEPAPSRESGFILRVVYDKDKPSTGD